MIIGYNDFGANVEKISINQEENRKNFFAPNHIVPTPYDTKLGSVRSIDSTKIRIPLQNIELIDPFLRNDISVINNKTGEILDDESFKKTARMHENNGIKTYYKIEKQITANQMVDSFCTILLTSKLLESNYFHGITTNSVEQIFESIQQQRFINTNFDAFIGGELTDTDIKYDFIHDAPATQFVNKLYEGAKTVKKSIDGCAKYVQKENCGIQFALRQTKSFQKSPYLKFYEKVRELNFKSTQFNDAYIKGKIKLPDEIIRCETTVKNKKHLNYLGATETTFSHVLENLDSISKNAFRHAFKQHINIEFLESNTLAENLQKLNSFDKSLGLNLISKIKEGSTVEQAISFLVEFIAENKRQRYDLKKKLHFVVSMLNFETVNDSRIKTDFYAFVKF